MKRCIGIGILLWALTLIWPDVNNLLTEPVSAWLLVTLLAAALIYSLAEHQSRNGTGQNHAKKNDNPSTHISRPVSVAR